MIKCPKTMSDTKFLKYSASIIMKKVGLIIQNVDKCIKIHKKKH